MARTKHIAHVQLYWKSALREYRDGAATSNDEDNSPGDHVDYESFEDPIGLARAILMKKWASKNIMRALKMIAPSRKM